MKALKSFDIVTALILLAGRIAKRRHEKLIAREASLKAAIEATQRAHQEAVFARIDAGYRAHDISRVK
ncbi:hypothetical protein [Pseudomonas phage PlaquesPlease]|uniref:Uncharacterized protein n=1 Tax=Pseudomonas phage PlaquesPlease TaxID=2762289 RepID=A0A7G8LJT8_9CAUD|nr:hypothetical protein [Pseudomonas phage PlaquesPlease]